jgi:integrase
MPLQAITSDVLVDMYDNIGKRGGRGGTPLATMPRKVHVTLHKALADAVPEHLPYNPATGVGPRKPEPETAAWTQDELNTFLAAARRDLLASAFVVTAALGLRRQELLGLEWRDVDLDAGEVEIGRMTRDEFWEMFDEPNEHGRRGQTVVRDKKGAKTKGSHAVLPLPPVAIGALRHHRKLQLEAQVAAGKGWQRGDRVFTDEIGRPLKPSRATKAFKRIADQEGLSKLSLHGLRHTFATLGLDDGIESIYMKELLRHASIAMLSRYQHTRPERLADAIGQLTADIDPGRKRRTLKGKRAANH